MKNDSEFGFSVAFSFVAHVAVIALIVYLITSKKEEDLEMVMAPAAAAKSIDWQDAADFLPDSANELPDEVGRMLDSPVPQELPTLSSSRSAEDPESRIVLPLPEDPATPPEPEPLVEEKRAEPKPPVKKEIPKPPVKREEPKPPVKKKVEPKPPVEKREEPKPPPVKKKVEPKPPVKKREEPKPPPVKKKVEPKPPVKKKVEPKKVKRTVLRSKTAPPAKTRSSSVAKKSTPPKSPPKKKSVSPPRKAEPVSVAKKTPPVAAPKRGTAASSSGRNTSNSPPPRAKKVGGSGSSSQVNVGWYDQLIKRTFEQNWREPQLTTGQTLYVKVKITVAPDGRVVEARFVRQSNVRVMDDSVVAALRSTTRIPRPLPAEIAGRNYTFLFTFKLTPNAR